MADPSGHADESGPPARRTPVLKRRVVAKRMSKRKANFCRYAIMLPIGLIALIAVLAQSGFAGRLLLPAIGRSINADVRASSVVISPAGNMVMTDVRVRNPDIVGPGGEIVSIARVEASIDWASSFGGLSAIRAITLYDPRVRVSFDSESDLTNLSGIRLPDTAGSAGPTRLPEIEVVAGIMEMGEHTTNAYAPLKRMQVSGSVQPDPQASDRAYVIEMTEIARGAFSSPTGTGLTGRIDSDGFEVVVEGVSLSGWGPRQVPRQYRRQVAELDLRGEINRFALRIPSQAAMARPGGPAGASATASVDGVELSLPVAADTDEGRLRLSAVSGAIEFRDQTLVTDVSGTAADVPMDVYVQYWLPQGSSRLVDARFAATITVDEYHLGSRPDFTPFLPADVGKWLRQFAASDPDGDELALSPTAVVSSSVRIIRDAAAEGEPAPEVRFSGKLDFSEGSVAYHEFPYPFESLRGSVQFNNDGIDVVEIIGEADTGARLVANGRISPLGEAAMVDLDLLVTDVPLDETLESALSEDRVETIRQLFDGESYEALVARGLILSPTGADRLRRKREQAAASPEGPERTARLSEIDRALRAPVFGFKGKGDLRISLLRPAGLNTEWVRRIEVRLPEAGVLLREFPLPIIARDAVIELSQSHAKLLGGSFIPLNALGGRLTGEALIDDRFDPAFSFRAENIRSDELLRFAIGPTDAAGVPRDSGRVAAAGIVEGLAINGVIDATGGILRRDDGRLGFDVSIDMSRVTLMPQPYEDIPPVLVSGEAGVLTVNESGLRLDASASAIALTGDESIDRPTSARIGLLLDWSDQDRGLVVESRVEADDVAASMPIEQVVAAFSGGTNTATDGMRWLRETYTPVGRVSVEADISSVGGDGRSVARLSGFEGIGFEWLGGRLALIEPTGVVSVITEGTPYLEARGVAGAIVYDGEPSGRASLEGALNLVAAEGDASRRLDIGVTGGRFESGLARAVAAQLVGGVPAQEYLEHEATGEFDATVSLTALRSPPRDNVPPGINRLAFVETELRPLSAGFTRRGATLWFDDVQGRVVASSRRTVIDAIRARGEGLSVLLTGDVVPMQAGTLDAPGTRGTAVELAIEAEAMGLTDAARAALPKPVNDQIDALGMDAAGTIRLSDGRLAVQTVAADENEPEVSLTFDAAVSVEGGSLVVGTPVDQIAGTAMVHTEIVPGRPAAKIRVHAAADEARMLGVWLRDGKLRLEGDGVEPGEIIVPHVSAEIAGGSVVGHASLHPVPGQASQPESGYQFDLRFADVSLPRVQDEIEASKAGLLDVSELDRRRPGTGATVDGALQLAGVVGRDETRRGRGSFDVSGGRIIESDGLVRLIELVNLQLPGDAALDYAYLDFVANGPLIHVDELSLASDSAQIFGYGTVVIPEMEVDLRFLTRGAQPYPIVDFVLNMIRDELFKTRITGRPGDLRPSTELVPETRRIIGGAVATEDAGWARAVSEMRRRAQERIDRERIANRIGRQFLRPSPETRDGVTEGAEQVGGQVGGQGRGQGGDPVESLSDAGR